MEYISKEMTLRQENLCEYIYDKFLKNGKKSISDVIFNDLYSSINEDYDKVSKRELNEVIELFKETGNNEEFKLYNGSIQLSDDRVIWEINREMDPEDYWYTVRIYAEDFEAETGVEIELDGRMQRHVVVENNYKNYINFTALRNYEQYLQDKMVEEIDERGDENDIQD